MWDDSGRSYKFKNNCFKGFLAIHCTYCVFNLFQSVSTNEIIIFKEIMPGFKEGYLDCFAHVVAGMSC